MSQYIYATFVTLSLLFGCSKSSHEISQAGKNEQNSVLKINIVEDPCTLDPRKSRDLTTRTLMSMVFEGLTRMNKDEKATPALAQVIEISKDLTSYTFYLRDAKWTNGDPVQASDFAYAWKKVVDPSFLSDNAFQLYCIKNAKAIKEGKLPIDALGVYVLDEKTLKVELEQPTPYFLELTAFPVFFPVNQKEEMKNPKWAEKDSTFVGCGPFRIVNWKHNDVLEVVKNESYWDAHAVKMSRIEMYMVKTDTEFKMYEKKELDWAGSPLSSLPADTLKELRTEGVLKSKPLLGTYFLRVNTDKLPFDNVLMRRAFAIAIDRQAIVEHVLQGNQIPATGLVPVSMGLQDRPYFQDHDVQEAKRLFQKALDELHMKAEDLPEITLMYANNERNYLITQAIQQQWFEAFGVRVNLQATELKVYFDRLSHQDYQICTGQWIADFNDPINFLEVFKYKKASTNNTSWENEDYIYMLDKSSTISDVQQRKALLSKSEDLLMKGMPLIPIFYYTMLYTSDDRVKEMVVSSIGNLDFKWAYLENAE